MKLLERDERGGEEEAWEELDGNAKAWKPNLKKKRQRVMV